MNKDDIDRRVAEFAGALIGPLGPKPLERVLRQHIGLFADLRQAGASWRQIAALMVRHGVTRKDGQPVDGTQWASMVSRALKTSQSPLPERATSTRQEPPSESQAHGRGAIREQGQNAIRKRMRLALASRSDG